ncbi:MAG: hypothetical protein Ta2B_13160 [Termitinemataceae bacterium]|nr:MAG: hypothetical protein Ta2B_13160 [Termitinemataceae bacterium]
MLNNIVFKKIHSEIKDEQTFNEKQPYVALGLDKKNTGPIQKIWGKVRALWSAVKNPDIPWYRKALPLAGLVYLVSPLDLVPDVIPGVGLLDDAAVILVILKNIGHKIRQISDNVIEKKITDAQTAVTIKIDALYADYKRNVRVSIILNAAVIAVTLIAHFFFTMNTAVICIVSIIPIIMMIRSIYRTGKNIELFV